jgi:hypothetical protein
LRFESTFMRDMPDGIIKAPAIGDGVMQINYEPSFLDKAYKDAYEPAKGRAGAVEK